MCGVKYLMNQIFREATSDVFLYIVDNKRYKNKLLTFINNKLSVISNVGERSHEHDIHYSAYAIPH